MPDVFSEIPKGLKALGDSVAELTDIVSALSKKIRTIRTDLQNADRTPEALNRIEGLRRSMDEAKRALQAVLQATGK